MAPKRRASDDGLPAAKERRGGNERSERLASTLSALNGQFASWVATNKDSNLHLLWAEGVLDYVKQGVKLLDEYQDLLPAEGVAALQKAAADATDQLQRQDGQSAKAGAGGGSKSGRGAELVRQVASLNRQFAKWVATNQESSPRMWWVEAARDYVRHTAQLLADFSDVLAPSPAAEDRTASGPGAATRPAAASPAFGAFGALGAGGGTVTSGLFGGATASQPAASGKGIAPATGFMAPVSTGAPPAAPTSAASSAAASGSSLFGSFGSPAPSAAPVTTGSGSAPSPAAAFGFSFGVPAAAPVPAAQTPAEAEAGKGAAKATPPAAAAAAAAPKPAAAAAAAASTAASAKDAAAAAVPGGAGKAAAAGDKAAAAPPPTTATGSGTAATTPAAATAAEPAVSTAPSTAIFKSGVTPSAAAPAAGGASTTAGSSGTFAFGVTSSNNAAPAPKPFTFGGAAAAASSATAGSGSTPAAAASSAPASAPAFTFGAGAPASGSGAGGGAPALAGSIFGGAAAAGKGTAAPAFSFGTASTAAPGAEAAGGSTAAAPATSPATGFFSFGAAAPAGGAAAPAGGFFGAPSATTGFNFAPKPAAEGEGEEEPEPEPDECAKEPSLQVNDAVELLFNEKARLRVPLKDDTGKITGWEPVGTGMLSVRKAKSEGAKPYIALFTEAGRCLFQAYIYKTMKLLVSDKAKSVAFSAVWSPDGTSPPSMKSVMFNLKEGQNRNFESVVLKLQEEMTE